MSEHRVDWHQYFMNIAEQVATRSTCDRKHVGAVVVRDKSILSTGYNGSLRGTPRTVMKSGTTWTMVTASARCMQKQMP